MGLFHVARRCSRPQLWFQFGICVQCLEGGGSAVDLLSVSQIGKMRYVSVRDFKGKTLVDIREYWMNPDGEMKPGKKGTELHLLLFSHGHITAG